MKNTGKPYAILLNSINPEGESAQALREQLEEKYGAPVITINCATMNLEDINRIMKTVLYEFPICEIGINIPEWISTLENDEDIKNELIVAVKTTFDSASRLSCLTAAWKV